jgi:prepilin-type N-terminal cleavage/methylation domain-containing protein
MQLIRRKPSHRARGAAGFTLVEMLVAVALVLLMMTLFAQVFQGATKSMNQQKGMAENDQKARRLTILMRGDLKNRTFVDVFPFEGNAPTNLKQNTGDLGGVGPRPGFVQDNRSGYFTISENDPSNNTDDVLQLTVKLPIGEYFAGRATLLKNLNDATNQDPSTDSDADPTRPETWSINLGPPYDPMNMTNERVLLSTIRTTPAAIYYLPDYVRNQPEFDDGIVDLNNTGHSQAAEVSYYLRNGNLYRRVMLIRQGYDVSSGIEYNPIGMTGEYGTGYAATYRNSALSPQVPAGTITGSGHFWRDFDYSAFSEGYYYYDSATMMRSNTPTGDIRSDGMRFHTLASLVNRSSDGGGPLTLPFSLGVPALRFGSTLYGNNGNLPDSMGMLPPANIPGWPREFDSNGIFFGRPTTQESSHTNFGYPGRIHNLISNAPNGVNPLDRNTTLNVDPDTGRLQQYGGETWRRGEDIVLTNVHEFDIQVYDDGLASPGFVQLGNSDSALTAGHYHSNKRAGSVNTYDTWHPRMPGNPPYRPITSLPGDPPGDNNQDDDGVAGNDDSENERGWLGSDDEIYLKAIKITIRYFDLASNQMRQVSLVHSLSR